MGVFMLDLCVSDAARDAESEVVVVQSGYYVIGYLYRQDKEIILSAHYVGRFIDIWIQEFTGGQAATVALQRFGEVQDRIRFITTMVQGFVDTGWTPSEIGPPGTHIHHGRIRH